VVEVESNTYSSAVCGEGSACEGVEGQLGVWRDERTNSVEVEGFPAFKGAFRPF